ncbi:MAG: SUMF1/EgtB/PvdO family nonheme iron enzyme [Anaerolineae bacterium]|nr:SUMF1/EgtB/PvdO family nonheme iron enzyme [Anaerolineae bacterium]
MARKDDLEKSIAESYQIIRGYEDILRTSDRPEEKARARRMIGEQGVLIQGQLGEYLALAGDAPSDDVAQIAHHIVALQRQVPDLWARLPPLPEAPCPYRGLEPFTEEDIVFYFGREDMAARLADKVRACPFVAVVGPSGCGKSSLVRAGLVAALPDWEFHFFVPGADPLRSLAGLLIALLEPQASEMAQIEDTRKLADSLGEGTTLLVDLAGRLRARRPGRSNLVLVADPFEELYTECQDESSRQAFVAALLACAQEKGMAAILTLRADFYGRVLADRSLGQAVDAGLVNVLPMDEDELRAAIEQPARRTGRTFEPGLVERILDDVVGEPGHLPLLEYALKELWARQTPAGVLTHAGYETIGQVEGAIAQRAEAIYAELERRGQGQAMRRILTRLAHYSQDAGVTRRRATLDELVTRHTPRAAVESVVQALAGQEARLLVTGQGEAPVVEVAHEALIRSWGQFRRWLDEDRAFGLWRERLAMAIQGWRQSGEDQGALLRGALLAEAEGWLEGRRDDLNDGERAFVRESLALREREASARARVQRNWNRAVAALLVLALVVVVLLAQKPVLQAWLRRQAIALGETVPFAADSVRLGLGVLATDEFLPEGIYDVAAFAIERLPVTNQRYLKCVEAGACSPPNAAPSTYEGEAYDHVAVANVTAYQAAQFCSWVGRDLPREKEWERAVRSGEDIVLQGIWEWTRSAYAADQGEWTDLQHDPPVGLVLKGGGVKLEPDQIAYRLEADPFRFGKDTGFRCVTYPQPGK